MNTVYGTLRPIRNVSFLFAALCNLFASLAHANLTGESSVLAVQVGSTIQFSDAIGSSGIAVPGFVGRRGREGTVEFVRRGSKSYSFISNDRQRNFIAAPQCWLQTAATPGMASTYRLESVSEHRAHLGVTEQRLATRCTDVWLSAEQANQPCAPREVSIRTIVTEWTFESSNQDSPPLRLYCVTPTEASAPSLRSLSEQFGFTFEGVPLLRPNLGPNPFGTGAPGAVN